MSWRNTGGGAGSGRRSGNDEGSVFQGGSAGGPSLQLLIGACVALGVVALALAFIFGGNGGAVAQTGGVAQPAPQAVPAVTAAATVAPVAATAAPAAPAAAGIPTEAQGPAVADGAGEQELAQGTDAAQLIFNPAAITAPANTLVTLTFNNQAVAVQHNWVLVDGGDDVANSVNTAAQGLVAQARNAAAAVPPADTAGLLVALPFVNPGESYSATFETPGPGTYEFICTFPGHYAAGMRGEFTVQ